MTLSVVFASISITVSMVILGFVLAVLMSDLWSPSS